MTAEEKLEKVRRYVNDELRLSHEQAQHWKQKGVQELYMQWTLRYDVLYGVLLTINE